MSGWLNGGNFTGVATRAQSRENWGQMTPTGGSQVVVTVARER
jgi:hypothetical protein